MKKQGGITLIALVITIIVLLILAGVSISMIVGQNGILSNAQNSVIVGAKAKEEEGVKTSAIAAMTISSSKGNVALENGYFDQELKNEFGEENYLLEETEDKFIVTILGTGNSYEVDKFGNVSGQGSNAPVTPTPEPSQATVTYNANGGNLADGTEATVTVNIGNIIGTLPADPSKSGSTFAGWYTAEEGGAVVTATTVVNGDMTVYAQWTTTLVGVNAASITKDYYGKTVNYTVSGVSNTWEIFYADSDNIYLIATNKVAAPNGSNNFSSVISGESYSLGSSLLTATDTSANYPAAEKWFSGWLNSSYATTVNTYKSMQATLYMLDSTVWNVTYKVDGIAKYVIGGPTLEMFCASYNAYNGLTGDSAFTANPTSSAGYPKTITSGLTRGTVFNRSESYWLASPAYDASNYLLYLQVNNNCIGESGITMNVGFRPVVCLESSVTLAESDGATDYIIQ